MKRLHALSAAFLVSGACVVATSSAQAQPNFPTFLDGSALPGSAGWTVDGDPGVIVDLGGDNFGIRQTDDDNPSYNGGVHGSSTYSEYYQTLFDPSNTLAARFRLDQYSGPTPRINLLALTPGTDGGNDSGPGVGLGIRNIAGQDRWALLRFLVESVDGEPFANTLLADLGPVVTGAFNEVSIHIDNPTDQVRAFWNGVEVYNATAPADYSSGGEGYPEFGASNYWAEGGTSTVTYDWVGYGPGFIPIPEPAGAGLLLTAAAVILTRRARQRTPQA